MDWYLVVPREDSQENPNDSWSNGFRTVATGGEQDPAYNGSSRDTLGMTPFDNSYFCTKWRILEKRRVMA